jgi:hypothetical protein
MKELTERYRAVTNSTVDSLLHDHVSALTEASLQLNQIVAPAIGAQPQGLPSNEALDRRAATTRLFDDVNAIDRSLLRLFAPESNGSNQTGFEAELTNYWRLRHDAATRLAILSQH